MGKLSDEEKATLEELTKRANEPDESEGGDDFEVEWWEEDEGGKRKGGRLPWSQARKMYGMHFPDIFGEKPPTDDGSGAAPKPEGGKPKRTSDKYFGRGE